jgi:hypothetical protein
MDFLDSVLERDVKKVVLPLLDEDARVSQVGRDMFGLQALDAASALRQLMRSGDRWLVACAIATAAELNVKELRPEVEAHARRGADNEVGQVALSVLPALA